MSLLDAVLPGLPAGALFSFDKRPILALPMGRVHSRVYFEPTRSVAYALAV